MPSAAWLRKEMIMLPENDPDRLLREQASALATAVDGMSDQLGSVSKGLVSLRTYGHRNRALIIVTIISLVLDLCLTVALAVVTANVIDNNQKINASVGSINCLIEATARALPTRTISNNDRIAVLNRKDEALAKDVLAQVTNSSAAARRTAMVQYLANIAAIDKTVIPPLPVFNPHC
jgi:hypothetical protein